MGLSPHCTAVRHRMVRLKIFTNPSTHSNLCTRIAIFFAAVIYIRAGFVIYQRREQLHGFLNPLNENPFAGWTTITTEVDITVEPSRSPSEGGGGAAISPDRALALPGPVQNGWGFDPYTVNVEVGEPPQDDQRRPSRGREILNMRSLTREAAKRESVDPGAWLYARVAFLFFVGMLIIWVRTIFICFPPPLRIP